MLKFLQSYNLSRAQIYGLLTFVVLAALHSFIATDKYIVGKNSEGLGFFIEKTETSKGLAALIPYDDNTLDKNNRGIGPFDKQNVSSIWERHWLGTDALGRDVLSGVIHGFFIALLVGLFTTLIAFIVGVFLGVLAGYFGDDGIHVSKRDLVVLLVLGFLGVFYFIYGQDIIKWIFALALFLFFMKVIFQGKKLQGIRLPIDLFIFRVIELFKSIPGIFLILVLLALFSQPHIINVIFVIALLRWPNVTRLLRAEIFNMKEEKYILSARAAGLSDFSIIKNYVLPQTLAPILIASAFGFASAILTESTLSFLGIGLPADSVTWGSMLNEAKNNISLWWLALFPGLMIYFVLRLFNGIGDRLSDYLKGKKH